MTKIHPTLALKLDETRKRYEKVTAFAEKLSVFADTIILHEFEGNHYENLANRWGKMPAQWGIHWWVERPSNYPDDKLYPPSVAIYINCTSLFYRDNYYDEHHKTLEALAQELKVVFYDHLNTTFYFAPEDVEDGLNKLETWYVTEISRKGEYDKKARKQELLKELEQLEAEDV